MKHNKKVLLRDLSAAVTALIDHQLKLSEDLDYKRFNRTRPILWKTYGAPCLGREEEEEQKDVHDLPEPGECIRC
eukprot:jgi/Psemu1/35253/gm1.35253_g